MGLKKFEYFYLVFLISFILLGVFDLDRHTSLIRGELNVNINFHQRKRKTKEGNSLFGLFKEL
jgi:hypothetical protein